MEYEIRLRETDGKKIYVDPMETDGVYLYPTEIKKLKIEDGSTLSEEQLHEIRMLVAVPRAKKRALGILSKRDKTEHELREKLHESYNDEESIEIAMQFVKDCDYINDYRYAEDYIYSKRKRKSFRMIQMELQKKGIPNDILQMVFEEYEQNPDDLREALFKYIKKFPELDEKAKQKIAAHFYRKGYRAELVRRLLLEYEEGCYTGDDYED